MNRFKWTPDEDESIQTTYETIQVQIREFCEMLQFTNEMIQVWIDSRECESINLKSET